MPVEFSFSVQFWLWQMCVSKWLWTVFGCKSSKRGSLVFLRGCAQQEGQLQQQQVHWKTKNRRICHRWRPFLFFNHSIFHFCLFVYRQNSIVQKQHNRREGGTHRQTSTTQAHRHTKNSRATFFLTKKDLSWLLEAQTHKAAGSLHFLFTFFPAVGR